MVPKTTELELHLRLLLRPLAAYLLLYPLLLLIALFGGMLADVGHPGGAARGLSFATAVLQATPGAYLAVSFLFLLLIRFRNLPCLLLNGAAFGLAAYSYFCR